MNYVKKLQRWLLKPSKRLFEDQQSSVWLKLFLNQLFPPTCLSCKARIGEPHALCVRCWKNLTFISQPYCQGCGKPFAYYTEPNAVCNNCLRKKHPWITIRAALVYDQYSSKLILPLKHSDKTSYAVLLARILNNQLHSLFAKADLVCPVPLHWTRLWQRKYNQSALIINQLPKKPQNKWLSVPDLLLRRKYTTSQRGLSSEKRAENLTKAIIFNPKYLQLVRNKRCIIVDDVSASGATLLNCGKVLKDAGAKKVYGAVIARTN